MTIRTKFIYFIIFASFLLMEISLRAQDEQPEGTLIEKGGNPNAADSEQQDGQEEAPEQANILEKFIDEIPAVEQAYQACSSDNPPTPGGLGTCIWGQIDEATQERITTSLAQAESETADGRTVAGFERNDLSTAVKTSDSVTRAFGDLIHKRLKEIIFDDPEQAQAVFDHTKFNEIYRSQLGRNLTESIAAFCLNVKYDSPKGGKFWVLESCPGNASKACPTYPRDPADYATNREANKGLLKDPNKHKEAEEKFNDCARFISNACSYSNQATQVSMDACGVVRHLKNTKQALIALDKIDKQWEEHKENSTGRGIDIGKRAEDFKVDDIVNVASGEIDAGEINDADQARRDRATECAQGADPTDCTEFTVASEDKDRMLSEYAIRKEAQFQRLKKEIGDAGSVNEEVVRSYLAEEGLDEAQIEQMIASSTIDQIAAEITQKYEKEKDNLIESLRQRLEKQEAIDPNNPNAAADTTNFFTDISQQSRAEEIKEVIHYTNVVSSFFRVCAAGMSPEECRNDDSRRNTAALRRELENSFFSPDSASGRDPSSAPGYNQDEFQGLSQLAQGGSTDDETKNLEIDEINNLLYDLSAGNNP